MSDSSSSHKRAVVALAALALAVFACWLWSPVLELSLLGWDAYPLIAAARVDSFGDFAGTFGEELMDSRYPLGRYYRPLVHLSFALDHALWGLGPRGYHATDLALTLASVLALGWLAYELVGRRVERAWIAFVAAGLAAFELATHPALIDVLPAVARRADLLALLFTLLALLAQSKGKPWIAALLAAAALGSKETGAIAAVVVGTLALARSRSVRALVPLALTVAVFLIARTAVLGGIGGGRESTVALDPAHFGTLFTRYLATVLGARAFAAGLVVTLALACLALVVALIARKRAQETERGPDAVPPLLIVWFLALVAITALSGVERGWYELPFVAIRCLAIAWIVALGASTLRASSIAPIALAGWLVVTDTWVRIPAPALDDLRRASVLERDFLERFERDVRATRDGARITVRGFPMELAASGTLSRDAHTIAVLAPYSLEAYAELALPERSVRLEYPGSLSAPAGASEVVVVLAP